MRKNYDEIIETNIGKISAGEIFSSKSELYRTLGFNKKSYGKEERIVLERHINQYLVFSSTANNSKKREIIIDSIRKNKEPFFDNRKNNKGGNNSIYVNDMTLIIIKKLVEILNVDKDENDFVTISRSEIAKIVLGLNDKNILYKNKNDDKYVKKYKEALCSSIYDAIESALGLLSKEECLKYDFGWILVSNKKMKNNTLLRKHNGRYSYKVNSDDILKIENATTRFCQIKNCPIKEVEFKYSLEYYSYVKDSFGFDKGVNLYKEYMISDINLEKNIFDYSLDAEEYSNALKSIRQKLSKRMHDFVYVKPKRKYKKSFFEQKKKDNYEEYEGFWIMYEDDTYIIGDDKRKSIDGLEKLHYSIFGEYMFFVPNR